MIKRGYSGWTNKGSGRTLRKAVHSEGSWRAQAWGDMVMDDDARKGLAP